MARDCTHPRDLVDARFAFILVPMFLFLTRRQELLRNPREVNLGKRQPDVPFEQLFAHGHKYGLLAEKSIKGPHAHGIS